MSPPERPSIPHSLHRVPTAPQPTVAQAPQPTAAPPPPETDAERLAALAHKIASGSSFTAEDLLTLGRIMSTEAVIKTRQDDKLRVDNSIGALQSKTMMAQESTIKRLKFAFYALLSAAGAMGTVAATCATAYQDARNDAMVPAAVAEAKASRAESKVATVAQTLEDRLDESDRRHERTERALNDIGEVLKANTAAINRIGEKLDEAEPPVRRKPR